MATYVNDLRLKEIGTGESSGTWGTETNVNLELIGESLGYGTEGITTNADTHTSTVADGSTDPARAMYIKYTGTLDSACTITIGPNTMSRVHIIENATSGSQNIIISQGSGANVTIPNGFVKAVYLDGAGSGAAVTEAFTDLSVSGNLLIDGATPTLTIGDAGAEDTKIVFDGNAQDFYIALDDSADDLLVGLGSTVGTTPAIAIDENLLTTLHGGLTLVGTTPTLTIGDAGAEDTKIVFDGNAQDFYIGLDDSADDLIIGKGSTVGTTPAISIDEDLKSTLVGQVVIDPADGVADDAYALFVRNNEATDGRNYGLVVRAGSTAADESFSVRDHANAGTYLKVQGDGNIGIANTAPKEKLNVSGAGVFEGDHATAVNAMGLGVGVLIHATGDTGYVTATSNGSSNRNLQVRALNSGSANANQLHLNYTGNIGLGTGSPDTLLDIEYVATNHTSGIHIANSQPGGYGNAISFISERSDNNSLEVAARLGTVGAEAWNADATTSSNFTFEVVGDNTLSELGRFHANGGFSVGSTALLGSISNSNRMTGGIFNTFADVVGAANNTATTMVSLSSAFAVYIVSVGFNGVGNTNLYGASAIIHADGTSYTMTQLVNPSNMTLSMSGSNVQATQTSGATLNISFACIRIQ